MRNAETLNAVAVADTRRSTLPPGRTLVREANPSIEVPGGETVCQSAVGVSGRAGGAVGAFPAALCDVVAAGALGPPPPRTSTNVSTAATTRKPASRERVTVAEGPRRRTIGTPPLC